MTQLTSLPMESRPPLTRDRILQTAISLADSDGIAALTMRRLGQELGVEAMSLYHHVAKKSDLLDGITNLALLEMKLPTGDNWKTSIRQTAVSAHKVLLRHPWACSEMMKFGTDHPARLVWMDAVLGCFRQAGFSAKLTHHAYHALDSHITGFTLWHANLPALGGDLRELAVSFRTENPLVSMPYLAEHIDYHIHDTGPHEESEFEFGLGLILDGLERLRDQSASSTG